MKSLQNFILLFFCFVYASIRGSARRAIDKPRRICVIQMAQFGDMICTTPVFRAIKRTYPQAQLLVVGNELNREVVQGNPDIDEYLIWNHKPLSLACTLRALRCDFAVTTSPNFIGLAILFLAGVPLIAVPRLVGNKTPLETRPYRILRVFAHIVPHIFDAYAPKQYLRLLEPIGIYSDDTRKHVYYLPGALSSIRQKLIDVGLGAPMFAVVMPGTGHPAKRWPPERFAAVAEHIARRHMPVVVTGGISDRVEVNTMMSHVTNSTVLDLSGQFSIEELKALIGQASLFVSGDTGPLYIAEALNVPTVDIVGPASDTAQPPKGPRHVVIAPPRTTPAMTVFDTRVIDPQETKRQAEATQVSEVTKAIDELIVKVS